MDPWDPAYGVAFSDELDDGALQESSAELNLDLELPAGQWRPVDPDPAPALPATVLFLDGVRRIDARVWVHGNGAQPAPGIAASFAAGLVRCDGAAHVTDVPLNAACSAPPPMPPTSPPGMPSTRPGSPTDPARTSSRWPCSSG